MLCGWNERQKRGRKLEGGTTSTEDKGKTLAGCQRYERQRKRKRKRDPSTAPRARRTAAGKTKGAGLRSEAVTKLGACGLCEALNGFSSSGRLVVPVAWPPNGRL